MRRGYVILIIYMCTAVLLAAIGYGSYRYSLRAEQAREEKNVPQEEEKTEQVSTQDIKITSETKYIVEIYNKDSEDTIRQVRTMPSEFAGMTREELTDYLEQYMETVKSLDQDTGLTNLELLSFSKNEVVLRKTYEDEKERSFFLKLENGEVVIYDETGQILYENTGIYQEQLPEEEIQKLEQGYVVENEKVLYSILENFSS